MICPNCQSEYREGFSECADCGIELVEKFSENPEVDHTEFHGNGAIEILQVMNFSEVAFIKSLLEAENIPYSFFDETSMSKTWGTTKARLFVNRIDQEKTLELLKAAGVY